MFVEFFDSFLGILRIEASDKELLSIHLVDEKGRSYPNSITMLTKEWLRGYFAAKEPSWRPPLRFSSHFVRIVSEEVSLIPFGSTTTYGKIAEEIGKPKAARAVGGVMRNNPYMIIVPCHRVVAKSGLGGYNGGIEIKKRLLEFERANR